jgi:hypothetical protein
MRLKNTFETRRLRSLTAALAYVALGVIFGVLLFRFTWFQFDWKFDVLAFLTLLLTFVIGFHLTQAVASRASEDRIEKDLLIAHAKLIVTHLDKIGETCRASASGEVNLEAGRSILAELKGLSNELSTFEMLFNATALRLEREQFNSIKRGCLRLKKAATGGSFPTAALTPKENARVQTVRREVAIQLVRLMFYLNRL